MSRYYDYIIIGSGIAGLYTALLAKEFGSVVILTKGGIQDCNTRYAQGGIAAPIGKNDSPELHYRDTIAAGDGLCDPAAVHILTDEAPDRIEDLIKFGVPFDTLNGEIALTKEAAHSTSRILHAGGDATGEHIEVTLSRQVQNSPIDVIEHCLATSIFTDAGRVCGVQALNCGMGDFVDYECKFVILATGGAGQLFKYTTNSDVATGDGIALAFQSGAEIVDMEFFQFHPTAFYLPGAPTFLISEAVRGEGGVLRNADGECFMSNYSPEADLAPRDVVARSIVYEMRKTGSDRVFLDVSHLPSRLISTRFPNIYQFCLNHGLNITADLIPVAPAAHYLMGGINVNTWGETNITGLFAAGETACTGVHGANRLASNSLLEVIVFSKRIVECTAHPDRTDSIPSAIKVECFTVPNRSFSKDAQLLSPINLQSMLWDKVGIIRDGGDLLQAATTLNTWQTHFALHPSRASYELYNLLLNARLMTESALHREESRGAHFRTDFPDQLHQWKKHIAFVK